MRIKAGNTLTADAKALDLGPNWSAVETPDYVAAAQKAISLGTILALDPTVTSAVDYLGQAYVYAGGANKVALRNTEATAVGTSPAGPADPLIGEVVTIKDAATVGNWAVSGAINNGSGLIRITAVGHGVNTGDSVAVYGVTGTTEANGQWIVTKVDANHVDLQGSAFTNAYVSGGTLTNRGSFYGALYSIGPALTRGGLTGTAQFGDDVNGVGVFNSGTGKASAAFIVNRNTGFGSASEFGSGLDIEGNTDTGIQFLGAVAQYGIDFSHVTYGSGVMLLPNNIGVYGANASVGVTQLFSINTLNEFQVFANARFANVTFGSGNISINDGIQIFLGTTSGTKIGTGATQKIGFFGATPVVQPNGTGNTHTVAAGATTSVFTNTTFDGSIGSTAYTVGDVVKALKFLGLLAA